MTAFEHLGAQWFRRRYSGSGLPVAVNCWQTRSQALVCRSSGLSTLVTDYPQLVQIHGQGKGDRRRGVDLGAS